MGKRTKKIELNFSQQFRSRFLLFQEEKIKVSSNVKIPVMLTLKGTKAGNVLNYFLNRL